MIPRFTFAVISLLLVTPPAVADISGAATVIDGDTIEVSGERVRLHGIDAPETRQTCSLSGTEWPCGRSARHNLAGAAEGATVTCVGNKRDRYGRLIAICYAGGRDINAAMVRDGWALAYRRYAVDYVGEESEARAGARGLWRGQFIAPWDWRRGERGDAEGRQ